MILSNALSTEKQTLLTQLHAPSGSSRRSLAEVQSEWNSSYSSEAIASQRSERLQRSQRLQQTAVSQGGDKDQNKESKINRPKLFRFDETVMHYSYRSKPPSRVAQTFQSLFSCASANALDPRELGEPLDLNPEPDVGFKVKPLPIEVRIKNRKETQAYYKGSQLPCQCAVSKSLLKSVDDGMKTIAGRWLSLNAQGARLGGGREMTFDILSVLETVLQERDLFSVSGTRKQQKLLLRKMEEKPGVKLTPKQVEIYTGFCKMNLMELHSLAKSVLEIRRTLEALLHHADQLFEESGITLETLKKLEVEGGDVHSIPSLTSLSSISQSSSDSDRYCYPAPNAAKDRDPYDAVHWMVESLEYTAQSAVLLREQVSGKKVGNRLRDMVTVDVSKLLGGEMQSEGDKPCVGALANGLHRVLHHRSSELLDRVDMLKKGPSSSSEHLVAA